MTGLITLPAASLPSNLVGHVFGRLTVTEQLGRTSRGQRYRARCLCGSVWEGYGYKLKEGSVASCGCLRRERCAALGRSRAKLEDTEEARDVAAVDSIREGDEFGRLTAERCLGGKSPSTTVWLCRCKCPDHNLVDVLAPNLAYHTTRSCGCLALDRLRRRAVRAAYQFEHAIAAFNERSTKRHARLQAVLDGAPYERVQMRFLREKRRRKLRDVQEENG